MDTGEDKLTKDASPDPSTVQGFSHHAENITTDREPYGPPGLRGLLSNPFVFLCAACSTLGGLIFGYDQGVVSVILVMKQFLDHFPRVAESHAGSGFWKGLMTAMIELGALIGALNQGWIADRISRRYSILVAVAVFILGSVLQTAAVDYPMLTVARLIGGMGIGMLSMVAPLYISEISTLIHSSDLYSQTNQPARPARMPRHASRPRRILHRPRHRDRLLDHFWDPVHGRRMGMAAAISPANGPGLHPCRRSTSTPILAAVACLQGPKRRGPRESLQAAPAARVG